MRGGELAWLLVESAYIVPWVGRVHLSNRREVCDMVEEIKAIYACEGHE